MHAHKIVTTRNNKQVYAKLALSPVAPRFARQPHLITLLRQALESADITQSRVTFEHNLGRQIGYCEIIETREKDTIFYARQLHASTYTRFVKHRRTEPTQYISGVLQRDADGNYEVMDVWLGKKVLPTPDSEAATEKSRLFWEKYAVVFNGQPIVASTQTYECPY